MATPSHHLAQAAILARFNAQVATAAVELAEVTATIQHFKAAGEAIERDRARIRAGLPVASVGGSLSQRAASVVAGMTPLQGTLDALKAKVLGAAQEGMDEARALAAKHGVSA